MIKESVGNAAKNKEADLKIVKTLVLKINSTYNVAPSEKERSAIKADKNVCEPELISYLARFQKMAMPSEAPSGGRVMPGSKTIVKLREYADASEKQNGAGAVKSSQAQLSDSLRKAYESAPEPKADVKVVLWDARLDGWIPKAPYVLQVDKETKLEAAIDWVVRKYKQLGAKLKVDIMAHGAGVKIGNTKNWSWEERAFVDAPVMSQGGGGIIFCDRWIQIENVQEFSVWKGFVTHIDLLACGAAFITPGFEGQRGDGNLLCYTLAQYTGATVRASTATQLYFKEGKYSTSVKAIDFDEWDGMVYTYDASGSVIKVEKGKGLSG